VSAARTKNFSIGESDFHHAVVLHGTTRCFHYGYQSDFSVVERIDFITYLKFVDGNFSERGTNERIGRVAQAPKLTRFARIRSALPGKKKKMGWDITHLSGENMSMQYPCGQQPPTGIGVGEGRGEGLGIGGVGVGDGVGDTTGTGVG
jgi:hypothetical protein